MASLLLLEGAHIAPAPRVRAQRDGQRVLHRAVVIADERLSQELAQQQDEVDEPGRRAMGQPATSRGGPGVWYGDTAGMQLEPVRG